MDQQPKTSWHILYIDDDEEDFILLRSRLGASRQRNIRLTWAATFAEGAQKLSEALYDAVLVDYDLGSRQTGVDLIRQFAGSCPSPLILYTGSDSAEIDLQAMAAGAAFYLAKSEANPQPLERAIRYAIHFKQQEMERQAAARQEAPTPKSAGALHPLQDLSVIEEQMRLQAAILESIHDAVIVTDSDFRITSWNQGAERTYGWQAGEVLGRTSMEVLRTELHPTHLAELSLALAEGRPIVQEVTQYTKDGHALVIDGYVQPLKGAGDELLGYVAVNHDITARKQAEAELQRYADRLEKSNQELENFAFAASHDLQEPLRKIEAFAGQLAEKAGPVFGDDERDYLERLQNAAERMRRMIEGLLSLSRVTSRGEPFTQVELDAVAHTVLDDLEEQIRQAGGQVKIDRLPTICGDATQLSQLLQNLISNGLKFHLPGVAPVVQVHTRRLAGNRIELVVADNGIGFDPSDAGLLFQPFQRLHGRAEFEGTGIGLSICRRIVERHKGTIQAQGVPGQGAIFKVVLPVGKI